MLFVFLISTIMVDTSDDEDYYHYLYYYFTRNLNKKSFIILQRSIHMNQRGNTTILITPSFPSLLCPSFQPDDWPPTNCWWVLGRGRVGGVCRGREWRSMSGACPWPEARWRGWLWPGRRYEVRAELRPLGLEWHVLKQGFSLLSMTHCDPMDCWILF